MKYSRDRPLISIHIPKCAGFSFTDVLKSWFGKRLFEHYYEEKSCTLPIKHNLLTESGQRVPDICIHGHFNNKRGFGVDEYYPHEKQRITIIRDPWELHISTYFYVLKQAGSMKGGAIVKGKDHPIIRNSWTLTDYLEKGRGSYLLDFFPESINMSNYKEVLDEYYMFIGLTEKLQESTESLAETLGKNPIEVPKKNISTRFEQATQHQKDIFYSKNELEQCIYEYVESKYN